MVQEPDKYLIRVRIEKLSEGVWLATSDDLPGLVVEAPTREELLAITPEVAHELIMSYYETGDELPSELLAQSVGKLPESELTGHTVDKPSQVEVAVAG